MKKCLKCLLLVVGMVLSISILGSDTAYAGIMDFDVSSIVNLEDYDIIEDVQKYDYIIVAYSEEQHTWSVAYTNTEPWPVFSESTPRLYCRTVKVYMISDLNNQLEIVDVIDSNFEQYEAYRGLDIDLIQGTNFDYVKGDSRLSNAIHSNIPSLKNEVKSSTDIELSMTSTQVNVTVPLNVSCVINPNEEESFTYSDIIITNNTLAPVKISLSVFDESNSGIQMIHPDDIKTLTNLDWNDLDKELSKRYFSIGLRPSNNIGTWKTKLLEDFVYAEGIAGNISLGTLDPSASASLELTAAHGRSFHKSTNLSLRLGVVAELDISTNYWENSDKTVCTYLYSIYSDDTVRTDLVNWLKEKGIDRLETYVPFDQLNKDTIAPLVERTIEELHSAGVEVWLTQNAIYAEQSIKGMKQLVDEVALFNSKSQHDFDGIMPYGGIDVNAYYNNHPEIITAMIVDNYEEIYNYCHERNLKIGQHTGTTTVVDFLDEYDRIMSNGIDRLSLSICKDDSNTAIQKCIELARKNRVHIDFISYVGEDEGTVVKYFDTTENAVLELMNIASYNDYYGVGFGVHTIEAMFKIE